VRVGQDGGTSLVPVNRSLPVSDSPLRDAIASLVAGPSADERREGLASMVPAGSGLRSVIMRGDTAVIDFSEGFRFNPGGREGMETGLRQVVWAATEFPTVRNVQLLIDGERVDYLGPEGVAIGSPLDRSSFAD
jgi:germination protein M